MSSASVSVPPDLTKIHIEDCLKRVRAFLGGFFIVDTRKAKLVWEHQWYPQYYFPNNELPSKFLDDDSKQSLPDGATKYDIVVGDKRAPEAVIVYGDSNGDLTGLFKIGYNSMERWFEEDEQVFVHPKDPYKRVDVLQSSRHVRVEVHGVEVANTHKPRLLFETNLPVRTYIPQTDCKLELLTASDLQTPCPYKGVASYYHVQTGPDKKAENVVWWYRNPNVECVAISGYYAFYDELVDIWIDGEKQSRPKTHFV
ncbi:MAG: DUF427-domain-containing protein [Lentinula lateritia]|uniref:DUF427-domain-containing protein n=1 Tax=Lentinula lateritia TaxID=40482 RepID=A0ABQ8VLP3_9AGAR|nr:DUF427-domain-containing protein [Lentinula novae-zelandiae]KAJ3927683.1 MAG: DUF427-domain-containing protein [Lentinula lateritia]KAJ4497293.1 DUF427-domain-containing protein [Lentinula lateritia]